MLNDRESRDWLGRWWVNVIAGKYADCKRVNFSLFRSDMPRDEVKSLLIECGLHDDGDGYLADSFAASVVEATFSTAQVDALRTFFAAQEGLTLQVIPAIMPNTIPDSIGNTAQALGGIDEFHMFCELEGYVLPFKVWGYCDLDRHCPICGTVVSQAYCPTCGVNPYQWRADHWERIVNAASGTILGYCRVDRPPDMFLETCLGCGALLDEGDLFLAQVKRNGGLGHRGFFCSDCAVYGGGLHLLSAGMLIPYSYFGEVLRVSTDAVPTNEGSLFDA